MRRNCVGLLLGAALLAGTPVYAKIDNSRSEARLAHLLEGRAPGKPVDCILLRDIRSTDIIGRTAIVYETNDGTLYVNRPSGAAFLRGGLALVTDTHSHQLCDVDIVRLYDTSLRNTVATVGLNEFVPYAKPKTK